MPRPSLKFACKGVDLAHPPNQMSPEYFPVLRNVRINSEGALDARLGVTQLAKLGVGPVHSLRRINNSVDSTFARLAGVGPDLFRDNTKIDTGYSGKPLSISPFRPNRSPLPFSYVGDGSRMRKISPAGDVNLVGIVPPNIAPAVQYDVPNFVVIADFEENPLSWAHSGTAGAASLLTRYNTTISQIFYDSMPFGWCTILPVDATGWMAGAKIVMAGVETSKIREVHDAITNTHVAGIAYDAGVTGMCSVVLRDVSPNLSPNSLIDINGEYVRVLEVITGQDGIASFRCITTIHHNIGDAVTGHLSFRAYVGGTYPNGTTIESGYFTFAVTKGVGNISFTGARKFDVITPTGEGGRPVSVDDYIHISVMTDNPANINQIRVILDIGDGSLSQNYLYFTIQPSDLSGNAWTEILFKVADLIRIGGDQGKSLATVAATAVYVDAVAAVQVSVAGWWIAGTYGTDVTPEQAKIQYAYRYRDSRTGAKSNASPFNRNGFDPQREGILLSLFASDDPQVDTIDVLRFGGGLNQWVVAGIHTNDTGLVSDDLTTIAIEANETASFDDYQPFPISDLPHAGRCDVVGTTVVWTVGDKFNVNWVPGSLISVNGQVCTLYGSPLSDEKLQLVQSAGYQKDAQFLLTEPTIAAVPLPATWMFGGQGIGTFMFGVGDPFNPGFLRWCKGNDPDTASDQGNLEITSPSEPLMNGFVYDARAFVFSTERLFALYPNFGVVNFGGVGQSVTSQSGNLFTAQEVMSGAGLYSRYGFCVTPHGVAWVGKDGIYLWAGGKPLNLTNERLYPLFPHEGVETASVNGYFPPDYTQPDSLRLSFASNSLFFTYVDINGVSQCLRFDFTRQGWFPENYTPAPVDFYQEEGANTSVLMTGVDGTIQEVSAAGLDNGVKIACEVQIPYMDMGDSRMLKYFPVALLDHQTADFTVTTLFDNGLAVSGQGPKILSSAGRSQSTIPLAVADGEQLQLHQNISIDITWAGPGTLYEYQPNAVAQPLLVPGLVTQYTDHGIPGYSHAKESWLLLISTADVTLDIWVDGVKRSFVIPSTGGKINRVRVNTGPLKAKSWMYRITSPVDFIPFPEEITVLVKRWGGETTFMPFHPFAPQLNTLGEGRAFAAGIPV